MSSIIDASEVFKDKQLNIQRKEIAKFFNELVERTRKDIEQNNRTITAEEMFTVMEIVDNPDFAYETLDFIKGNPLIYADISICAYKNLMWSSNLIEDMARLLAGELIRIQGEHNEEMVLTTRLEKSYNEMTPEELANKIEEVLDSARNYTLNRREREKENEERKE